MSTRPASLISSLPEGGDMARRRLQQKGSLYQQGGWWKLRWREDQIDEAGLKRGLSKPAWIGPCEGQGRLTEKQAQRIAWENFLSRLDQNNTVPQSVMTVQEFVDRKFLPEHVAMLKKGGRIHYDSILKHVLPSIGTMRLRDVTGEDIQRLVAKLIRGKYSVQTAKHARNAVSAIFRHAIEKSWYAGANPASKVRLPEMRRKPTHALSFEQARAVIGALKQPYREMVLTAVLTSMNIAEICGLVWKRVNLTEAWAVVDGESLPPFSLHVVQQWRLGEYTSVKEKTRNRPIELPAALVAALLSIKQSRGLFVGPEEPVFASASGKPVDQHNVLNRHLKPVGRALGMPWLSWHVFRRTTATIADQLGMGTADRKALLGHGTDAMASHYVQGADRGRQRELVEQIAAKLFEETGGLVQ
ncbi:MAG TPA: tyrosine-type recombinase/integrase [Bryobacteraceae bacterium]|nr:tyrosine-type recombinase/integrase [Bryobacteraceae bacterium]